MQENTVVIGSYNNYEILELIGKGGTSEVYKAKTLNKNGSEVETSSIKACKILLDNLIDKEDYFKRFQLEAGLARRLLHPNIVNVHDSGQIDGRPFLILDYIEGPTLSSICKAQGPLPPNIAIPIFMQIGQALAYAHLRQVVHRDLKPSNIILENIKSNSHFVRVVDFGIAKIISETTLATKMTKTGEVFGTPTYMSPEQCRGEQVDTRSDIYSLGVLMYEVLTGHPPFEGHDSLTVLYKQLSEMPKNIGSIDSDVRLVKKLESILFKCLEKNPDSRYQTIDQLNRDLETCLEESISGSKLIAYVQQLGTRLARIMKVTLSKPLSAKGWVISIIGVIVLIGAIALWNIYTAEQQAHQQLVAFVTNNPQEKRIINWVEPDPPACARDPKLFNEMEKKFMDQEKVIKTLGAKNTIGNFEYESKMADVYLAAGSFTSVDQIVTFANKIATALNLADSSDTYRDVAELQEKRAKSALGQRNYANCIIFASESLKLHERFKSSNPDVFATDTIPCLDLIGQAALAQGNEALANKAFSTVYDLANANGYCERFPNRNAYAFARASDYFIDNSNLDKGRILLKSAILGWDRTKDYLNEGIALNKLALTYLKENKPQTAVEIFEKAIEIIRNCPRANHNSILSKVLLNEADAYQMLGDADKANYCQKAAKELWYENSAL